MTVKRVVLIGIGHIIGMVKIYLLENTHIELVEVTPDCYHDLELVIEREQPSAVILEQSPLTQKFFEKLLVMSNQSHFKIVEVNPDDNNIRVSSWNQVQLKNAGEFVALL